jgi:hypothetical protein
MSRISNELAQSIAFKLTVPTQNEVEKLHGDFRNLVWTIYDSQTPKEVKELAKKFPDYFEPQTSVKLHGHGFNWEYVGTEKQMLPNNSGSCIMNMNKENSSKLFTAKNKWEKAKKKYEDLKRETKGALLALKTFNNIRKEIPNAAQYLPPPMSNALVCNFTSLNKKLQSQPELKKEEVPA